MKDHYIFCGNQTICNATYRYFVPESYRNTFELLVDGRGGALSNLLFQVPTYSDDMNVSSFNTPDYTMTSFTDIDEQLVGPALQYMAGSMGILTLCSVVLLLVLLLSSPAQVGRAQYWSNVIGLACESALGISRVWLCIYGSISSSQFALARGYSYTGFSTGWYAASGFGEVLTVLGLVFAEIVPFLQGREILNQLKAKSTKMVYTAVFVWFLMLAFVSIVLRIVMVALYFDRLRPLDSILSSSYSEDSYQGMYAWDMVITLQNIAQRLSLGLWALLSLIQAIKLLLLKLRGVATTTEPTWVWTIPHGILVFIVRSQIIPLVLCAASVMGTDVNLWTTAAVLALAPLISLLPADEYHPSPSTTPVTYQTNQGDQGKDVIQPVSPFVAGGKCHDSGGSDSNTLSDSRVFDRYDRMMNDDRIELETIVAGRSMG